MFVHCKPFQESRVFVGNAGAYPNEAHFRCSTLGKAPGLAHKQQTILERLAWSKHSSLLRNFVTYGSKTLYNIGPWCPPY